MRLATTYCSLFVLEWRRPPPYRREPHPSTYLPRYASDPDRDRSSPALPWACCEPSLPILFPGTECRPETWQSARYRSQAPLPANDDSVTTREIPCAQTRASWSSRSPGPAPLCAVRLASW